MISFHIRVLHFSRHANAFWGQIPIPAEIAGVNVFIKAKLGSSNVGNLHRHLTRVSGTIYGLISYIQAGEPLKMFINIGANIRFYVLLYLHEPIRQ
jgi:hypothetical protein